MPNQAKQAKDKRKGNKTGKQVESNCFSTLSIYEKMDFNLIISRITFNVNKLFQLKYKDCCPID